MTEFQDLLEPNKLYRTAIKDAHAQNVDEFFENLVIESNVDVEGNKNTNNEIKIRDSKIAKLKNSRSSKKGQKGLLIAGAVIFFVAAVTLIIIGIAAPLQVGIKVLFFVISAILIGLGIFFFIIISKKINPAIKNFDAMIARIEEEKRELIAEAMAQMAPLNALFDWNIPAQLITKTVPLIQMDAVFDKNKFQYLHEKYGFNENVEPNISSIFVQSGSILGNPFILERNYVQEMGQQTYSNSITIHWTTYVRTDKGTRAVHHSETLTASITKPKPMYYLDTWLVYSNDAAPKLHFSRKPSKANSMSQKEIDKATKEFDKKLDKAVEKAREKNGSTFTEMSNLEFEYLFGAIDRNNDVEFRLLFTPLAQKSMLDLIKTNTPYGDDFTFIKDGPLNYISTRHGQTFDYDGNPTQFTGYDVVNMKDYFKKYCNEYMQSFFYELAPLMCIPLYQQHQTFEYIYEGKFATNVSSFETEVMANKFGEDAFKHPESDTHAILKRTSAVACGKADQTIITAHSFKAIPHVEIVSKFGKDGNWHDIPITWFEYIPLEQVTEFSVQQVNGTKQQFNENLANGKFDSIISKYGKTNSILFQRGLISFLASSLNNGYNGEELNNIFNTKKEN